MYPFLLIRKKSLMHVVGSESDQSPHTVRQRLVSSQAVNGYPRTESQSGMQSTQPARNGSMTRKRLLRLPRCTLWQSLTKVQYCKRYASVVIRGENILKGSSDHLLCNKIRQSCQTCSTLSQNRCNQTKSPSLNNHNRVRISQNCFAFPMKHSTKERTTKQKYSSNSLTTRKKKSKRKKQPSGSISSLASQHRCKQLLQNRPNS